MNKPEWIKYDGSDKQIAEINDSVLRHGFILRNRYGSISPVMKQPWHVALIGDKDTTHYLICKPHQYADLIKIWADTGCPVWVRPTKPYEFEISDYENHPTTKLMVDHKGVYLITTAPDWNIPGEYRLTPFED